MRAARLAVRVPLVALFLLSLAASAAAQVPTPAIEEVPSPGGAFVAATSFDLGAAGYEQAEYFISASADKNTGPLGTDGRWSVTPSGTTADYKTRIVVFRPKSPKKFGGTVIVEWLNVSGGVDAAADWMQGHVEIMRQRAVWIGVSAQKVGVEGGDALLDVASLPLKQVNPGRYGSLHHPGDSFSYDIFSQAAQAARAPSGPLGSFKVKRVIAAGESQSAFRLVTYINAVHPLAHVYDGFLVHSRGGIGAPLSEAPQPPIAVPGTAAVRDDVDVPVLTFQTETDLTFLGYVAARQDDATNFRLWEVAGTAHYDTYGLVTGGTDLGKSPEIAAPILATELTGGIIHCDTPINSGPQHYVLNAAIHGLIRWVRTGKAPKSAPRIELEHHGPPSIIARDATGNALGGIRTPWVDVPIAVYTGEQSGSILCGLFGTTRLLDDAELAARYPTRAAFAKAHAKALRRAVKAGWIRKPDAKLIQRWARRSGIGA
jgi:hypothetical protein